MCGRIAPKNPKPRDRKLSFKYQIDGTTDPVVFDVEYAGEDPETKELYEGGIKGIMKWDGADFVRCHAQPGQPRPDKFTGERGGKWTLIVLTRPDRD